MARQTQPLRLVKLLLPVNLVREMDAAIVQAAGAYQDRNEFVTEAIRDRIVEDKAPQAESRPAKPARSVAATLASPTAIAQPALNASFTLGGWLQRHPATVPAHRSDAISFGLHNRDLTTLWALDRLALLAVEFGGPVPWDQLVSRVRREGAEVGSLLRQRDLEKPSGQRAGIGFPKPGPKGGASLDRFVSAAVGSYRRADGPFFDLALAGSAAPQDTILPTDAGLAVLEELIAAGLGASLPQPGEALEIWWRHLREMAPAEYRAWHKLLRVLRDQPTREELVLAFPEWHGNTASTNTIGLISRSREWGLIEPDLIDQRYRLTELGLATAGEA